MVEINLYTNAPQKCIGIVILRQIVESMEQWASCLPPAHQQSLLLGGLRRRGFGVWVLHLVNEGLVAFRKDALPRLNDAGADATSPM
jgi:hypothetical protein